MTRFELLVSALTLCGFAMMLNIACGLPLQADLGWMVQFGLLILTGVIGCAGVLFLSNETKELI